MQFKKSLHGKRKLNIPLKKPIQYAKAYFTFTIQISKSKLLKFYHYLVQGVQQDH